MIRMSLDSLIMVRLAEELMSFLTTNLVIIWLLKLASQEVEDQT